MPPKFTSRTQIIANLASERARFLHAIYGLTTTQLNTPLWDDWSARSLIPHIALWDAREADRLHKIAAGQSDQIANIDVDAQNATWHAQHKDTAIDVGVAMLQKERNGLLNALAALSDEQLKSTTKTQHHDEFSPMYCLINSIDHDTDHALDVANWRAANGLPMSAPQLGPKSILIALLRAGLKDFEATAAAVAAIVDDATPVCGHWSLKQLIAHMASWETYALNSLQARKAGPIARDNAGIDAQNEALVNERLAWPVEQIWDEYRTARKQMIEAVGNMDEATLAQPIADAWSDEDVVYSWCAIWPIHDIEHAQDLRTLFDLDRVRTEQ